MTSEQIAELRKLTHRCKGSLPPCECDLPALLGAMDLEVAPLPLLQRILDEREALLGALRWIAAACEDSRTQAQIAKEAIAKAEAP